MDHDAYGVRRSDIDELVADGEHCAICGTDEEKLFEVAVVDEDDCVLVCKVCLAKHGVDLDEEEDDALDGLDTSAADDERDDDM